MKTLFIFPMVLLTALSCVAQTQYNRLPYKYNSFIKKTGITWACEMYDTYSFESQDAKAFDIHSYLVNAQKNGKIKSYINIDFDKADINTWKKKSINDYYIEVKKEYGDQRRKNLDDSITQLEFHEIFYLQNNKLRSQVVSAGPQFKVFTSSGVYVGNTVPSFSSVNYNPAQKRNKKDKVIFLGTTEKTLNFDSVQADMLIKKTYNMSLPMNIWYGLSKGFNKVTDLKTNQLVPVKQVMEYSAMDSIQISAENSDTTVVAKRYPGPPAYQNFSELTILQKWFYNKTKDIFFTEIPKVYIHTKYLDEKESVYKTEKRFEVIF